MKTPSSQFFCATESLSDINLPEGDSNPTYRQQNCFELIWISKGTGSLSIDFERHSLQDDMLYCIFPGQIQLFTPTSQTIGKRIRFSKDLLSLTSCLEMDNYLSSTSSIRAVPLCRDSSYELATVLRLIEWENSNNLVMKDQVFEGFVKLLMSNFLESKESDTPRLVLSNDHNVYIKFLASVERLYVQKKQVSEYADELAVSANYLSEVIKRISGYSASFHIQQRIILEAKRKSKATDNSMKKIAFELGFEDPSTFSKYFRTNTGTNFTDFRKECLF